MTVIDLNHARAVAAARAAGLDDPEGLVAHMTEFIDAEVNALIDARMKAARLRLAGSFAKMFAAGCAVGFGVHGLLRFLLSIP